jgi:hypothetical protein
MTPEQIASNSEHSIQSAFFCWANLNKGTYPQLETLLFSIPNGGQRSKSQAAQLRAEGVKKGVPDVFLSVARKGWNGLYIEFKRPGTENQKEGTLTKEQKKFAEMVKEENYYHFVAYSYGQAAQMVVNYLS